MPLNKKIILFDLDGVIINSLQNMEKSCGPIECLASLPYMCLEKVKCFSITIAPRAIAASAISGPSE